MAKKFSGDQNIEVTPKSKSTTWQYTGGTTPYEFTLTNSASATEGYNPEYRSFAVKSKNDLVITTMFATTAGKVKKVTNTIKNYFKEPTADYKVYYTYYTDKPRMHTVRPDTAEGTSGLFGTVENALCYLASSAKNADLVTFSGTQKTEILDLKGNDKYKTAHTTNITDYFYELAGNDEYWADGAGTLNAYDWAGADTYRLGNGSKLTVHDYAGKDTYTVEGTNAILFANEYAGNDKYYLKKNSDFWINEYKGNDTYWVTENKSTGTNKRINDTKGDDKYYLTTATIDIVDQGGKDRYEIENTSTVTISDSDKGNDTIIMKECSDLKYYKSGISDYSYIGNVSGNETYTLNNVSFTKDSYDNRDDEQWAIQDENGNDKYNITDSQYLAINDKKGNDTYIFNSIYDSQIADDSGKDSYNITHSNFINIDDYNNDKDKYTLTNCSFILNDFGKSSADTYNLTNVKESKINDKGGNDKYTLKKTADFTSTEKIHIYDYAGKDTYNLSGYSHDNNMLIQINDVGTDNDTYNLKYITAPTPDSGVFDNGGKDTYKITDCDSIYIRDSGEYKDTYNITNTDKFSIYDNGETSDSYTVNNSNGYIADHNGDNDTLNIKGAKKSDIIFMTEIDSSGSLDSSHCLFAYNKLNERYTIIVNFFDGNDKNYTDFGEGRIETIKVNGKTVKEINIDKSWEHFNDVKDNVVNYLLYLQESWKSEDSISTYDVLENGSQSEINNLIAAFNGEKM